MQAEITFDLIMEEDMDLVEGCYRLSDGVWQVFIFGQSHVREEDLKITTDVVWKSGVRGVVVDLPRGMLVNKSVVLQILSDALGVTDWSEVRGPDSMQLR
jgi:hypothetical protein